MPKVTVVQHRPRTGDVFLYHGYRIAVHEAVQSPARFRKFRVTIKHELCGTERGFEIFGATIDQLRIAVQPHIEAHDCHYGAHALQPGSHTFCTATR